MQQQRYHTEEKEDLLHNDQLLDHSDSNNEDIQPIHISDHTASVQVRLPFYLL